MHWGPFCDECLAVERVTENAGGSWEPILLAGSAGLVGDLTAFELKCSSDVGTPHSYDILLLNNVSLI